MEKVLVIGGSDSSGGAGVQVDIKALSSIGVHACTVITAITAQNTKNVYSVFPVPIDTIKAQFHAVMEDLNPRIAKIGMLYDSKVAAVIAKEIYVVGLELILDPVLKASVGSVLSDRELVSILKEKLIPNTKLITPNIFEAEEIAGLKIANIEGVKRACKRIKEMNCEYVLIKGGDLEGKASVDVLYDGKEYNLLSLPRLQKKMHGKGCAFASLVAGFIAKGLNVPLAVKKAKEELYNRMKYCYEIGKGLEILNQNANLENSAEKYNVLKEVEENAKKLEKIIKIELMPETGINLVYSLPYATNIEDVCGIEGRIVRVGNRAKVVGTAVFGASKHVARVVLTAMEKNRNMRAGINIKYSPEVLGLCKEIGLKIGTFEREKEPKDVSTMAWGTKYAIDKLGFVPDVIYDSGGKGKEGMIRILGKEPKNVVEIVGKIASLINS
ncbi:MAG: bifunctional hydroxymethylpyrimidine kinase/phosphomethylpyrimidine kinase [Candidatus Thermoplasmatota archaeon]